MAIWVVKFASLGDTITEGSCLMRISLLRISLLRFFKKNPWICLLWIYALCFGSYFISLMQFFGYFFPTWLMWIFSRTKSRIRQEHSVNIFLAKDQHIQRKLSLHILKVDKLSKRKKKRLIKSIFNNNTPKNLSFHF